MGVLPTDAVTTDGWMDGRLARAATLFQAFADDAQSTHRVRDVASSAYARSLDADNGPDVDKPDQVDSDHDGLGEPCVPD